MLHRSSIIRLSLPRSTALLNLGRRMSVYPDTPSTPTDLLTALPAKFQEAQQSGQLFFFPSQAKDIYSQGKRASHSPIID
jgi:hypothetical protein